MVKDLDRINPRRHGQDMRSRVFRQPLLAKHIVRPVMGAIKKPVVAGEAEPAVGPDPTRGGRAALGKKDVISRPVVLRQPETNREHLARRAPGDGGERPHLAVEMRHHVEVIDILGDEGGIRLDIDQREILVAGMSQHHLLAQLEGMGGIKSHL